MVASRFILCCALSVHTFLASNNETRERNFEGQKNRERMMQAASKLIVLRYYVWNIFLKAFSIFVKNFLLFPSCAH